MHDLQSGRRAMRYCKLSAERIHCGVEVTKLSTHKQQYLLNTCNLYMHAQRRFVVFRKLPAAVVVFRKLQAAIGNLHFLVNLHFLGNLHFCRAPQASSSIRLQDM